MYSYIYVHVSLFLWSLRAHSSFLSSIFFSSLTTVFWDCPRSVLKFCVPCTVLRACQRCSFNTTIQWSMGTISMPSPMGPEGPAGPKLHTQQVWRSRFESKQSDFRTTCLTALQRCIPAQQYSRAQSQQQRTVQNAQHSGAFTASKKRLLTFLSLWQSNNFNLVYLFFFFLTQL